MSFILDALKKSEQERRQGEVPGLRDESPVPTTRKGTLWLVLLATALLVNGVVLGWWLSSRQNPAGETKVTSRGHTALASAPAAPLGSGEGAVSKRLSAATPEPVDPDGEREASVAPTGPRTLQRAEQVGRPVPAISASVPAPAEEPSAVNWIPEMSTGVEQPEAAPAAGEGVGVGASSVLPEEAVAVSARAGEGFPFLRDLAAPVRSRLPELSLQLHFFTADPERRLIRLNGTNLREGEQTGDIAVIAIDPDGVRLLSKGTRFFLPAGG